MKILFINHFPLTGSGSGVYTCNLAKSLRNKGHECAIVFPENRSNYERYEGIELYPVFFKNEEVIEGVDQLTFNFPCFTTHPRSTFAFSDMSDDEWRKYEATFEKEIRRVIDEFKPDIVHAQHIWALAGISASCCETRGIPMVVTCHGTDLLGIIDEKKTGRNIGTRLAKRAAEYAYKIITISKDNHELLNELLPEFSKKVVAIRNGADSSVFFKDESVDRKKVLEAIGVDPEFENVVCFAGKLTPIKNVDVLLKAAADYENENVVTLIAGDGELRGSLEEFKERLCLKNVMFLGNQPHDILNKIYNIADCSLILSKREAFGLVAIEAMMCGAPVIASNHGALPEFVTEDVGILVDPDRPETVAKAVKDILTGEITFDRKYVSEKMTKQFSQDSIIDEFVKVYEAAR